MAIFDAVREEIVKIGNILSSEKKYGDMKWRAKWKIGNILSSQRNTKMSITSQSKVAKAALQLLTPNGRQ